MSDIKPCPFCGEQATVAYMDNDIGVKTINISCENPKCGLVVFTRLDFVQDEQIIARWNNRSEPKHGYWYYEKKHPLKHGSCRCSVCGSSISERGKVPGPNHRYCPWCGSKNSTDDGEMIFKDQED